MMVDLRDFNEATTYFVAVKCTTLEACKFIFSDELTPHHALNMVQSDLA